MPDMPTMVPAIIVAAVLAGGCMLLAGWPWRAPHAARLARGWPLVTGIAFLAGALVFTQRLPWGLLDDRDRMLAIFIPCVILIETLSSVQGSKLDWALRVLLAADATRILLAGSAVLQSWTWWQAVLWQGGLGGALLLGWASVSGQTRRGSSPRWTLVNLALANAGAGVVVMLSAYITSGPLGLILAAALLAAVAASLAWSSSDGMAAAARVAVAIPFALLVSAHFFASLSLVHAALVFAAPLLAWLPELPAPGKLPSWARGLAATILIAIPLALAGKLSYDKPDEPPRPAPVENAGDYSADDYESFRK